MMDFAVFSNIFVSFKRVELGKDSKRGKGKGSPQFNSCLASVFLRTGTEFEAQEPRFLFPTSSVV